MAFPGRYRVRWRTQGGGCDPVVRWHVVAASSPDLRAALLAACRGAARGELRITHEADDGTTTTVMTDRAGLAIWDADATRLPEAREGEWSREMLRGGRRSAFFRSLRALLRDAVRDKVLELGQAASIAHAVSLALDGAGPFSRKRTS